MIDQETTQLYHVISKLAAEAASIEARALALRTEIDQMQKQLSDNQEPPGLIDELKETVTAICRRMDLCSAKYEAMWDRVAKVEAGLAETSDIVHNHIDQGTIR